VRRTLVAFVVCWVACLLTTPVWAARPDKNWKSWFGHIAGGYDSPTNDVEAILKDGWNFNGGATYWPEHWKVGLALEFGYNFFDIEDSVLDQIEGSDTGDVEILSVTADFIWGPDAKDTPVGVYLTGGIGGYYVDAELGRPGVWEGIICDPWLWWCYSGVVPGTVVTASESTTRLGWNVGAALTFKVGLGSQLFIEAKYHRVETETPTEYIPLVIGYRW
jgi:opacity protein-like surface antigen